MPTATPARRRRPRSDVVVWTTRNLPRALHERLRRRAFETHRPMERIANEALGKGLDAMDLEAPR